MTPKNIKTVIRWMGRMFPCVITNERILFTTAHYWRFDRHDEWRVQQCHLAYMKYGVIPDFAEQFIRHEIYPHFCVEKILLLEWR